MLGLGYKGKYCKHNNYYEIDKILDVEFDSLPIGLGKANFYVKWKGYGPEYNEWVPYGNVTKHAINEFLQNNGMYDYSWEHRCIRWLLRSPSHVNLRMTSPKGAPSDVKLRMKCLRGAPSCVN